MVPTFKLPYEPNLNDPRVHRRIRTVLDWALPKLSLDEPFECHKNTLTELFGNQSSNALGKVLRAKLLREQCASYKPKTTTSPGFCKTYRISESGFNRVAAMFFGEMTVPNSESKARRYSIVYAQAKYKAELAGTKPFKYEEKSYRLYHELQGFRREQKDQIFEGWYNYDIATAMPNIFWNMHRQTMAGANWSNRAFVLSSAKLTTLDYYINNKAACWATISQKVGINTAYAKLLLNGLFIGMKLSPHYTCAAYKLLGFDPGKFNLFAGDQFVVALLNDIRRFWILTARYINRQRKLLGREPIKRSLLYFYHERFVLDAVRGYLNEKGVVNFLEHDGFRVKEAIDLVELQSVVKIKTGYDLNWDEMN